MSAALALQKALRNRLASDLGVLALVPASNIADRHGRPQSFPAIVLGEDLEAASDLTFDRRHVTVYLTLHLWHEEPGVTGVKAIASTIRNAIRSGLTLDPATSCVDIRFENARFIRDPDGLSHGIVTLEALVEEAFA